MITDQPKYKQKNRVDEWDKVRSQLKEDFLARGITSCELKLTGCMGNQMLSFAHYKKRRFYYSRPELLGDFNQVLLACANCHNKIEYDKHLTEVCFKRIRGIETFRQWDLTS